MIIKPFKVEDFDNIKMKPDCWAASADRRLIEAYAAAGPGWTLYDDSGEIIVCGGFIAGGWPGIADVWLIPSVSIGEYPLAVVKGVKGFLDATIERHNLYRVQATIMEPEVKWIEMLGFEREGKLRKFGPNKEDKYIYARVE